MKSTFFISNRLAKKLEKDINKRKKIEDEIDKDMKAFNKEADNQTVLSVFQFIEEKGSPQEKRFLKKIKNRYENSYLIIEDTLNLIDWYEQMCEYYNNKISD